MKNKYYTLTGLALLSTCAGAAAAEPVNAAGKDKASVSERPNVLFICADQWRRQAVGFMGEDPIVTPNLDAMSKWCASFDHAISNNPVSGPNRACMFTGKYTIHNGLWANNTSVDPEEKSAMGTVFKNAGYDTGYIGKWHMNGMVDAVKDPSRRLGFDYWYQSIAHTHFDQRYYAPAISEEIFHVKEWSPTHETDLAIEYMKDHQNGKPYCLVVSFAPPHTAGGYGYEDRYQPGKALKLGYGYGGPREFEALYTDDYEKHPIRPNVMATGTDPNTCSSAPVVAGYFGAVTSIDHEIGRMIDYLEESGQLENTIIVVTADHGEMMGSQGMMTKGVPYEESAGIPMMFAWKGKIKAARRHDMISSIDLVPTMAGLADVTCEGADGLDFSDLLLGKKFNSPEYSFSEFNYGGIGARCRPWRAIYTQDYVYILCGPGKLREEHIQEGYVLYDLKKDPYQLHPILKGMGYDKVIAKMHKALAAHLDENHDPFINDLWNTTTDALPLKPYMNKYNYDPNLKEFPPKAKTKNEKINDKKEKANAGIKKGQKKNGAKKNHKDNANF